jgi:coenzyme F420-reducing hydrogenase delta subunit
LADKPFVRVLMAEIAKQHNTYGFVSYMREQAETARTARVAALLDALVNQAERERGAAMSASERTAFRKQHELYALLKVDEEIDSFRAEFEKSVLEDGGTAAGLQEAWRKGAGGVTRGNWRSESHFKLGAVEYLSDGEFVAALRNRRKFETRRVQNFCCALDELRADGQRYSSSGE